MFPGCKCGGLTEAWRIAWMAQEHNVLLVPGPLPGDEERAPPRSITGLHPPRG